jgi:carboxylesterase type B
MIQIDSGLIEGVAADGVRSFKGIPYAAPPLGELGRRRGNRGDAKVAEGNRAGGARAGGH